MRKIMTTRVGVLPSPYACCHPSPQCVSSTDGLSYMRQKLTFYLVLAIGALLVRNALVHGDGRRALFWQQRKNLHQSRASESCGLGLNAKGIHERTPVVARQRVPADRLPFLPEKLKNAHVAACPAPLRYVVPPDRAADVPHGVACGDANKRGNQHRNMISRS